MYAIVDIAGKQYKVSEKDKLYVPLQDADVNKSISFDNVLLVVDGETVTIGKPVVKGAKVKAKVLDHVKADKVIVFKKKRRKRYRVKKGHRQPYTQIEIDSITAK
ncbi:MAG: 50S ribosomal protein L21 [Bacteroidetes bacterium]|nr:50S ribosomal protein L21 [Bacteroidota bacterium]